MASSRHCGLLGLFLSTLVVGASAESIPIVYCAKVNTGTTSANSSIYQSEGLCHDFCVADYAYAVIQDTSCWCSDYTPTDKSQVSVSECDTPCAGYPSDSCGGGDGLYGYMSLNKDPIGTATGSSSSTTSTSSSTSSSTTQTTLKTSTSSTSSRSSSSSSTSSSSTSKSKSGSTSVTVHTVTAGGVVQTVTVTPSPGSGSESPVTTQHKGVSTGAAVGIAIGVIAIVAIAGIIAFLVWRRKRQQRDPEDALFATGNPKTPSPRGTSPNTSASPKTSEMSTAPAFARRPGEESDQSGRRRSTLMPIDPRIDPAYSGIYTRPDNKSHDSVNSLRDDHDYSRRVHQPNRVLRATNPDPDDDREHEAP